MAAASDLESKEALAFVESDLELVAELYTQASQILTVPLEKFTGDGSLHGSGVSDLDYIGWPIFLYNTWGGADEDRVRLYLGILYADGDLLDPAVGDSSLFDPLRCTRAYYDSLALLLIPAAEETRAPPMKRSIGGFADEDDLLDFDDAFIEPPPKRVKSDAVSPAAAASEASAPKAAPVAQASTASSLSKGKDAPAAAAAPPFDLRGVISSLEAFASQFTSLEADKIRLQEEAKSSSSKLDGAIKKAAVACQEVDSLKEEMNKMKEKLREEEARVAEKDELLRQSALALLEAASIPVTALDKIPSNSPANGMSMVLTAHQLTRALLDKGKGALTRMHSMIFPKAKQEKTLGQLIDAFAVDTKEVIEVFPVPSFVDDSSGVLPEGDRIRRMKDRITQMEKDMHSTYALAAIVNKKSEIAADVERYALTELHKATESLNFDVGITLRVLDIAIPGANYEAGPAQGLDKLDLHAPQLGLQGKKTPIRILLGLL
ncbi:hypothetical protein QYE76_041666 [Lolium multiflorum]|uniref:Uncharacterized protein n=1 Tax=Lolium multiflorum TaxID=4521 RepID=A0AAD8TF71_LOLMU|nr:hypothetical protein QYE76_041666 [Lolium multiflorum]